jgi:hypothetical protein
MTSLVSAVSATAVAAGYLERAWLFVDHDQVAESKINLNRATEYWNNC